MSGRSTAATPVGQIVTFGTLQVSRGRQRRGTYARIHSGGNGCAGEALHPKPAELLVDDQGSNGPDLRDSGGLYESDERYKQLLDYETALEGLARHSGVHAAGVVIAPGPLDEYVPVFTTTTKGAGSGAPRGGGGDRSGERPDDETVVVTQYDMTALEKVGLLKMDFLGLTTLTVLADAVASIQARTGVRIDLDALPLDDDATYRMLRSGRTSGVFQFESPLATDVLRSLRCDRFDDLVASNALMRPGPLDTGMHRVYVRRKRGEAGLVAARTRLEPSSPSCAGNVRIKSRSCASRRSWRGSRSPRPMCCARRSAEDPELIHFELGKFVEKAKSRADYSAGEHLEIPRRRSGRSDATAST